MALTIEDQAPHDMSCIWENHPKSDNSSESKSKENLKPLNQKEERNEALMNKKRQRDQSSEGKDGKSHESDHDMHMCTERERRKKMRNMFANLHALLPHLPSKADRSTIVDEAVSYIKNLQQTLQNLEKQKRAQCVPTFGCDSSSMFVTHQGSSSTTFSNPIIATSNALSFPGPQAAAFDKTWASSNIILNIVGNEAQFSICAAHKRGLMSTIAFVLEKYQIELISANISSIGNGNSCMIQFHGKRTSSHYFLEASSVEEIYKLAAGEIMLWVA